MRPATDNIQEGPGQTYVGSLFYILGGYARLVWILEEREDGWLGERIQMENPDLPPLREWYSRDEWTRNPSDCVVPPAEVELDDGTGA